jgi:uroporphyrinogen-III synthase
MLVTRPEPDASETAARLGALGIEGVPCPLLVHQTLTPGLPDANGFAAIAVTSTNALRALRERGMLERYLKLPLYAVGARTAAAAKAFGFTTVTHAEGGFVALAELLAHTPIAGPIFYPAARELAGDLAKSLAPFGRMVITAEVYAMNPVDEMPQAAAAGLADNSIGAVLLYSRRTAETFVRLADLHIDRLERRQLGMLCLSEAVAEPLFDAHFVRVSLAEQPSEQAMMGLALSFSRDQNAS